MISTLISKQFHSNINITTMKHSFYLKKDHQNKDGKFPLYLNLSAQGKRKRLPVEIYLTQADWDVKKQTVKNKKLQHFNLIINEIKSAVNKIEIHFRLTNQTLTVEKCIQMLKQPDLNVSFHEFAEYEMHLKSMEPGTLRNHKSILGKLKVYQKNVLFSDINDLFIQKYRKYLSITQKNAAVTIDSNIKLLKHYISLAKKRGHIINIDTEDIKIKHHRSTRTNLSLEEVQKLSKYYFSDFILEEHKKPLGYFLFNCMTGQRIEDLLRINREDLENTVFTFYNQKSKKHQSSKQNETCKKILDHDSEMFVKKITSKSINETIKKIASFLGIRKHLSAHVARHTFATNYLRVGGKVETLQVLLGHSKIETTMIYVHIVESEALDTLELLTIPD